MKWLLVLVQIVSQTIGEVCRAVGMRQHGEIHDFRPDALGRVARRSSPATAWSSLRSAPWPLHSFPS